MNSIQNEISKTTTKIFKFESDDIRLILEQDIIDFLTEKGHIPKIHDGIVSIQICLGVGQPGIIKIEYLPPIEILIEDEIMKQLEKGKKNPAKVINFEDVVKELDI